MALIFACSATPAMPDDALSPFWMDAEANYVYFLITITHWLGPSVLEDTVRRWHVG